jgi:hypothetical protein
MSGGRRRKPFEKGLKGTGDCFISGGQTRWSSLLKPTCLENQVSEHDNRYIDM